jgi:hypothetical protein
MGTPQVMFPSGKVMWKSALRHVTRATGAPVVGAEAATQYGPPPVAEAAAISEMIIIPN